MNKMTSILFRILLIIFLMACTGTSRAQSAVTGKAFEAYMEAQDSAFQSYLEISFGEADGFFVTGPMDPSLGRPGDKDLFHSFRILCPDPEKLQSALDKIKADSNLTIETSQVCLTDDCEREPLGYRGAILKLKWNDKSEILQLNTFQQMRWLIWWHRFAVNPEPTITDAQLGLYAKSLSDHLFALTRGWTDFPAPVALATGLPGRIDFYLEPPPEIIKDRDEYKRELYENREINNDSVSGLVAFVPGDSLLNQIKAEVPQRAYLNREAATLQHEIRDFLERGGHPGMGNTLTTPVLDTLPAGWYIFAVGMDYKIRFSRALKDGNANDSNLTVLPNQSFLFPGEPVLTSGSFKVEVDSATHITAVNAYSEKYFYSNRVRSIHDDIAEKSNSYFQSLGYFFKALDRAGIKYSDVLMSKF